MSEIKKHNFKEISLVSGGNANSNYEGEDSRAGNRKNSGAGNSGGRNIYNGVDSCGAGIMGGLVAVLLGALLV